MKLTGTRYNTKKLIIITIGFRFLRNVESKYYTTKSLKILGENAIRK